MRKSLALILTAFSFTVVSCGQNPQNSHVSETRLATQVASAEVGVGGFFGFGRTNATLYYSTSDSYAGAVVISPGAKIPARSMRGLATAFAQQGYLAYVVHYALDMAIIPTEQGKAEALAKALRSNQRDVEGLPAAVRGAHVGGLSVSLLGHSMGGAVLGKVTESAFGWGLKSIFLLGVSSTTSTPDSIRVPVRLLHAERDGLVDDVELQNMERAFSTTAVRIPGVNHFCIIDDASVGDPTKRAEDGSTELAVSECQSAVVQTAIREGI